MRVAASGSVFRSVIRSFLSFASTFGLDLRKTYRSVRGLSYYLRDRKAIRNDAKSAVNDFPFGKSYPCLDDRFDESGIASGHYFHQDLLVARKIFENRPLKHVDIGSRVDGFVAHVASFRPIEVLDIRALSIGIRNIEFTQADLLKPVDAAMRGYCDSLSCLHAIEHFGLGRYGDPVDYNGHIKGFENIYEILKQAGKLYLSTPIGPQRIEFNAHRVFSLDYLLRVFAGKYSIDHFSFVDDAGNLHENVELNRADVESNLSCTYGCGIFELTKL